MVLDVVTTSFPLRLSDTVWLDIGDNKRTDKWLTEQCCLAPMRELVG